MARFSDYKTILMPPVEGYICKHLCKKLYYSIIALENGLDFQNMKRFKCLLHGVVFCFVHAVARCDINMTRIATFGIIV